MKIVVNRCYGGWTLSEEAYKALGIPWDGFGFNPFQDEEQGREDGRYTDPRIVEVVERLGAGASGSCAHLVVVEIPDGIAWEIDDYDGWETIHEKHRSW